MKIIPGLVLLGAFSLFSVPSFAIEAKCKAVNSRTGQTFFASSDANWPKKAIGRASEKAMWKCHTWSEGWKGSCFIHNCFVNKNFHGHGYHNY